MKTFFKSLVTKSRIAFGVFIGASILMGIAIYFNNYTFIAFTIVSFFFAFWLMIYRILYVFDQKNFASGTRNLLFFLLVLSTSLSFLFYKLLHDPREIKWSQQSIPNIRVDTVRYLRLAGQRPYSTANDTIKTKADFEVFGSFQEGIYEWDVWLPKLDTGKINLKGFKLNGDTLAILTKSIAVKNPTDKIKMRKCRSFYVVDGGWGKPYPAKFELWFEKMDSTKDKIKLAEKYYYVRGLQR